MSAPRIGLIGYGEVGSLLAADLMTAGAGVAAFDIRFADPADPLKRAAASAGVDAGASLTEVAAGRDLVISAVTAGAAHAVSVDAAPHLASALFVDLNSVSPRTRQRSAAAVAEAGGRYVEAAVMAPIAPQRIATPILLGGEHAVEAEVRLAGLGFKACAFSPVIGRASAVKMCRSVFVKGLESIVSESLLAARRYGVEAQVLASLSNTIPHPDWPHLARYLVTRTLIHGRRRSEEMVEAAATVTDVGLPAPMSLGAVERQAWAADLHMADCEDLALDELLDRMLARAGLVEGDAA